MLSLANAFSLKKLLILTSVSNVWPEFIIFIYRRTELDGLAVNLIYENGILSREHTGRRSYRRDVTPKS